jgi:hypothetical protein
MLNSLTNLSFAARRTQWHSMPVQEIQEGEEITIDYGPGFFEDCPCVTCKPKLPDASNHSLGKKASKNREEIEEEKREKKRAKRQKQKERKKNCA